MSVDLSSGIVDVGNTVDCVSEGNSVVPRVRAVVRIKSGVDHVFA